MSGEESEKRERTVRPRVAVLIPGGIGEEDYVPSLLDLLVRLSAHVDLWVFSFSRQRIHPKIASAGPKVILPPEWISRNSPAKMVYLLGRLTRDLSANRFDLIHGFWASLPGMTAVLAGKLLGAPSLVSIMGGEPVYFPDIEYGGAGGGIQKILRRWTIDRADAVTVLTSYHKRVLESGGYHPRSLSVISLGVDLSQFPYRPKRIGPNIDIGFVGSVNNVKNPFTLVRAFSIIAQSVDCRLTIAGPDLLGGKVQAYASSLGVGEKIKWLGKIGHAEVPSLLQSLDLLLLPSRYEGEGVVAMEAYASGTLVAGSRVGLLAEAGEDVTAGPGDAGGLARKTLALLQKPELVEGLRVRNRKVAEAWGIERTVADYLNLYESIGVS